MWDETKRLFKQNIYFQLQVFMLLPMLISWGTIPLWLFFLPTIVVVVQIVFFLVLAIIEWNQGP